MFQSLSPSLPQAELTALNKNQSENRSLGWVTITHPFHPLQGKRLEVSYFYRKQEAFLLKDPSYKNTIIPRDWTDRADPDPCQSLTQSCSTLSIPNLLHLVDFLGILKKAKPQKYEGLTHGK